MMSNLQKRPRTLFADDEAPIGPTPSPPPAAGPPTAPITAAAPTVDDEAGAGPALDLREGSSRPRGRGRTTRRQDPGVPAPGRAAPAGTVVRLTEEQWAWVDTQALEAGIPKWQVVLTAVAEHVDALEEHFVQLVPEGGQVFHFRAPPRDVAGRKIERSIRVPVKDRVVLDDLVAGSGAVSMSAYLRAAVAMRMGTAPTAPTRPRRRRP
jgi:hypothetical protein